jgi:hypothetical protein
MLHFELFVYVDGLISASCCQVNDSVGCVLKGSLSSGDPRGLSIGAQANRWLATNSATYTQLSREQLQNQVPPVHATNEAIQIH